MPVLFIVVFSLWFFMKKIVLSNEQQALISRLMDDDDTLGESDVVAIASGALNPTFLEFPTLFRFVELANSLYRAGLPIISDRLYDSVFIAELKRREPSHPFLQSVEADPLVGVKTVELPSRMLSTDKAYAFSDIQRWARRVEKTAESIGHEFSTLIFRGTPKLDGFAAYDDGHTLYTRGDGKRGTDVTRAFDRGLQVAVDGDRGLGAGEIVIDKEYFAEHLATSFDNSRNIQASIIKEKALDPLVAKAISDGAATFFPFALLPEWKGTWDALAKDFDSIVDGLWNRVPYDVDGVVFEIVDPELQNTMGATRRHHRWQLAFKKNTDIAQVTVLQVNPQTSRSGRVNPVAEVEPTRLSGALIQRVTAHHYGMVQEKGIGAGAIIEMSRSGEVIPKIERVVEPAVDVSLDIPDNCPSCGEKLSWDGDYLFCLNNMSCPAQISTSIEHFFKVLGNVDGFGPSSIQKLFNHGVTSVAMIYKMSASDFEAAGFGPKQSQNMVAQLGRSRSEQIEDWRFLASFGVHRLGMGNCEKLLEHVRLLDVFALTENDIVGDIKGFQEKSAQAICSGLLLVKELFDELYALGFTLEVTELLVDKVDSGASPILGKVLVFSGSMESGSRAEMEKEAKNLGAIVGKTISGKTDILVAGKKVGASKMDKAQKLGVTILVEESYRKMLLKVTL